MTHHHSHDTHDHHKGHVHIHPVTKNLKIAFFLNLGFTLIEFVGGFFTNSMAIMSDAVHDLGDTVAIGSAIFLEKYSEKKRDKTFSYGYKRFSPLSALINSIVLLTGSILIVYETVPRLFHPEKVEAQGMLLLAILGLVVNGAAVLRLQKGENSLNQKAVMLHLMEDVLGWIAVLVASILMLFWEIPLLDPLLSLGIAAFISWNAVKNLRALLKIFLQAVPENINLKQITEKILEISSVKDLHDLHAWTMDGSYTILTMHVVVENQTGLKEIQSIKEEVKHLLYHEDIHHCTIEIETEGENCGLEDC